MLPRLSQAIVITFFLYLITGIDKPSSLPSASEMATPQESIGLKVLPQPTARTLSQGSRELSQSQEAGIEKH